MLPIKTSDEDPNGTVMCKERVLIQMFLVVHVVDDTLDKGRTPCLCQYIVVKATGDTYTGNTVSV